MYDVVIIGAGVIGCATARELSRYKLKTLVIEKEVDVCAGTSKANSAIVHAGFDAMPNTLKGRFNAKSNLMFDKLSEELDFDFIRNGSLVLCFDKNDIDKLYELKKRGEENGVPNLRVIDGDELRLMEHNLTDKVVAGLYAPTGGIVCPFTFTIALAENANINGVEFKFNSKVVNIIKNDNDFSIITENGVIETKMIVNAAGVYSDNMNNFVSEEKFEIIPRRGEYNLFDKYAGSLVEKTLFQLPTELGKGVLVTPTVDGNLLIGPNAVDIEDKEDLGVTRDGLDEIMKKASLSVKSIPLNLIITSFSGLRAKTKRDDFIIGEPDDSKGFINAAGIESPGLSCAPLIGEFIKDIIVDRLNPEENKDFNPIRRAINSFNKMSLDEKKEAIKRNPHYGTIVCRCEMVTEAEIIESINRPLGASTLDAVKRRTRAGAGRCQCGFCITRIMEILNSEKKIPLTEIRKFNKDSKILVGKLKEDL